MVESNACNIQRQLRRAHKLHIQYNIGHVEKWDRFKSLTFEGMAGGVRTNVSEGENWELLGVTYERRSIGELGWHISASHFFHVFYRVYWRRIFLYLLFSFTSQIFTHTLSLLVSLSLSLSEFKTILELKQMKYTFNKPWCNFWDHY